MWDIFPPALVYFLGACVRACVHDTRSVLWRLCLFFVGKAIVVTHVYTHRSCWLPVPPVPQEGACVY